MSDEVSIERNIDVIRSILSAEDFLAVSNASVDGVELIAEGLDDGPNIASGTKRFYDPDGYSHAVRQVDEFVENPKRLSLAPAPPTSRQAFSEMAVARLYDRFAANLVRDDRDPALETGYLVSLGLGLGLHLPMLLARLPVRNIVIVEQSAAMVRLSLAMLDWVHLAEETARRGGRLFLFVGGNPQAVSARLYETLRGNDMCLLDGSVVFPHYASSFLNEVAGAFASALPMIGDPVGFLEDEALMLRNAADNLSRGPDGIISTKPKKAPQIPAFIIGSGPSIDDHIDVIHAHKDKALIITGGTGLGVMLEHGIVPDLHCEIENGVDIYTSIADSAERHGLANLTLVGSVTVDPRIPPFFGRFVGVFRDVLSSTRVFSGRHSPLEMAGPTVTNLACRTAITAGCREVYLFGTDLGSTDPDKHHSNRSLYAYSDDPYWQSGAQMEKLNIPVQGNLREMVYSSREFLFTKLYFDTMTSGFPSVSFRNCSDGVRIAGAEPFRATDINLPALESGLKTALIEELMVDCQSETDFSSVLSTLRTQVIDQAFLLQQKLRSVSDTADVTQVLDVLKPYLADEPVDDGETEKVARFMLSGSLMMMVLAANSLVGRAAEQDRQTILQATLHEIDEFAARTGELFDKDP